MRNFYQVSVCDLDRTDEYALFGDYPRIFHVALNHLTTETTMYGVHFAPKCIVLFQDRQGDPLALTLCGKGLKQSTVLYTLGVAFLLAGMSATTSRHISLRLA